MRKDLDGETREFRATEECEIGEVPRRVNVCAARGEEARWSGSGEDDPEREDMEGVSVALSSRAFTLEASVCFCCCFQGRVSVALVDGVSRQYWHGMLHARIDIQILCNNNAPSRQC